MSFLTRIRKMLFDKKQTNTHPINFGTTERILVSQGKEFRFSEIPEICPHCHKEVGFDLCGLTQGSSINSIRICLAVFQCPACKELTVGRYLQNFDRFDKFPYIHSIYYPEAQFKDIFFDQCINNISKDFQNLYNQAAKAEHYGCIDIAGAGYRKATEFLIRDFAKHMHPDKKEAIDKTEAVRNVVKNFLQDFPRLKEASDSALVLGNDETHYSKIYTDYDLSDLKDFINITCTEIAAEIKLRDLKQRKEEHKKQEHIRVEKHKPLPEDLKQ